MLRLIDIQRVDYDGCHNAFTDLVFWRDAWYLAFRSGESHKSLDEKIVLMRSAESESWSEAAVFTSDDDARDPKFLATPDRLILYHVGRRENGKTPLLQYTADGDSWTEPQVGYHEHHVWWRPRQGPDGAYYVAIHTDRELGGLRRVALCRSPDGLTWEEVSPIWSSYNVNETAIEFTNDGDLVALVRGAVGIRNQVSEKAVLAFSSAPYTTWDYRATDLSAGGPELSNIGGTLYAVARKFRWIPEGERLPSVTSLYVLDDRVLHEFLTVPSGGDCSYAALADAGDGEVAMSDYSSHEGRTSVYLARFEVLPMAVDHTFLSTWIDTEAADGKLAY